MCGIVGYVGHQAALDVVVDALRRMEYRGYDWAGIALVDGAGDLTVRRRAGRLANLESALAETDSAALRGTTGVGHTRWATHGRPTDRNAHPHRDAAGKIAVVHNSIMENYVPLRHNSKPPASSSPATPTPSRCPPRRPQLPPRRDDRRFTASGLAVLRRLEGHFTLVFTNADDPGTIVAARRSTPLVVGIGKGEMFVGSDVAALIGHTREAVELGQDQAVAITADSYRITDFDGNELTSTAGRSISTGTSRPPKKGGDEYFMLKEIAEQPTAVADTLLGHSSTAASCSTSNGSPIRSCARSTRFSWWRSHAITPGCGQIRHRALDPAARRSRAGQRVPSPRPGAGPQHARRRHLAVGEPPTPWKPSAMPRSRRPRCWRSATPTAPRFRANAMRCSTPCRPQIGVASTKTFLAQVAAKLVGLALAQARGTKYPDEVEREYRDLEAMPNWWPA